MKIILLLLISISLPVAAEKDLYVPDYVSKSLDKVIIINERQTYTTPAPHRSGTTIISPREKAVRSKINGNRRKNNNR